LPAFECPWNSSPLQELYLEHNQLSSLPRSLVGLSGLRRLYVEHNPQLELPPELAALPALAEGHGYANNFKEEMRSCK
jgi:Leucine-rich repeat (LRR) protein